MGLGAGRRRLVACLDPAGSRGEMGLVFRSDVAGVDPTALRVAIQGPAAAVRRGGGARRPLAAGGSRISVDLRMAGGALSVGYDEPGRRPLVRVIPIPATPEATIRTVAWLVGNWCAIRPRTWSPRHRHGRWCPLRRRRMIRRWWWRSRSLFAAMRRSSRPRSSFRSRPTWTTRTSARTSASTSFTGGSGARSRAAARHGQRGARPRRRRPARASVQPRHRGRARAAARRWGERGHGQRARDCRCRSA